MAKGKEEETKQYSEQELEEQLVAVYQQLTPETTQRWEAVAQANPNAQWNENNIKALLPFIKKVMPRIGTNQSLFGFSIISLEGRIENEAAVVEKGLEPLLKAEVLSTEEAAAISSWYAQTEPTRHSGGAGHFLKDFSIDGTKYRLITDSYMGCRDLNLQIV